MKEKSIKIYLFSAVKKVMVFVGVFVILVALFVGAMVAAYSLSTDRVRYNMAQDVWQLQEEGLYPRPFFGDHLTLGDNFTEVFVLNMITTPLNEPLLDQVMANWYARPAEDPIEALTLSLGMSDAAEESVIQAGMTKYWNGAITVLRPLVWAAGYRNVRYVSFFLYFFILTALLFAIRHRLSMGHAACFLFAMLSIGFYTTPSIITMVIPWIITLLLSIIVLYTNKLRLFGHLLLFFLAGCCTNFFDYLLTLLFPLCLPLILLMCMLGRHGKGRKFSQDFALVIGSTCTYFLGFIMTWVAKWALSSLVLSKNIFAVAMGSFRYRSGEGEAGRFAGIAKNYRLYFTKPSLVLFLVFVLLAVALFILFRRTELRRWNSAYSVVAIMLYPCIWYFFASNHSDIHAELVYRFAMITPLAGLCGIASLIDYQKMLCRTENAKQWVRNRFKCLSNAR